MIWKAKLLRLLTRKPWGLAYFIVKRQLYPKLIRLDRDSVRTNEAIYIIEKSKVFVEAPGTGSERVREEFRDKATGSLINAKEYDMTEFYTYTQGIPVIFFDHADMIPVKFEHDKYEGTRNPFAVNATLSKELAAMEAEMLRKTKSTIVKYVMISMVLGVIAIGGIAMLYGQFISLQDSLTRICNAVAC
jgi:hypothetical protein